MALVYYKRRQYEKCLLFANRVLKLDPGNEKNLLRKFNCELQLDTNKAEETLKKHFPNDQSMRAKLEKRQEEDMK